MTSPPLDLPRPAAPRQAMAERIEPPAIRRGTARSRFPRPLLGAGLLCAAIGTALALAIRGRGGARRSASRAAEAEAGPAAGATAARCLHGGAAVLSFSVLTDSALEHYRGCFFNPAMYVAPTVSALTLAASLRGAFGPHRPGKVRRAVAATAALTGIAGTGFHLYNVLKRPGGFSFQNLFYAAPLGAPAAISVAGVFGLAASRLADRGPRSETPRLLGLAAGPVLAAGAAAGLVGTVGEVALFHFRGAFQDPFMYVPVTVPPLAALALAAAAVRPTEGRRRLARVGLGATGLVGLAGVGFHAYGIHRNMGGWRNWSQMVLQGPPLPAPPSFTGMALAGAGALALLDAEAAR